MTKDFREVVSEMFYLKKYQPLHTWGSVGLLLTTLLLPLSSYAMKGAETGGTRDCLALLHALHSLNQQPIAELILTDGSQQSHLLNSLLSDVQTALPQNPYGVTSLVRAPNGADGHSVYRVAGRQNIARLFSETAEISEGFSQTHRIGHSHRIDRIPQVTERAGIANILAHQQLQMKSFLFNLFLLSAGSLGLVESGADVNVVALLSGTGASLIFAKLFFEHGSLAAKLNRDLSPLCEWARCDERPLGRILQAEVSGSPPETSAVAHLSSLVFDSELPGANGPITRNSKTVFVQVVVVVRREPLQTGEFEPVAYLFVEKNQ